MHLPNRSDLVKVAVKSLLRYIKTHGAENMRVEFAKIAHDLDGRTHRYEIKPSTALKVAEPKPTWGKKEK